ncbi:MAG TPA: hypothetical protein VGH90_10010 [Chthoniobacteraceae bacterium]
MIATTNLRKLLGQDQPVVLGLRQCFLWAGPTRLIHPAKTVRKSVSAST